MSRETVWYTIHDKNLKRNQYEAVLPERPLRFHSFHLARHYVVTHQDECRNKAIYEVREPNTRRGKMKFAKY